MGILVYQTSPTFHYIPVRLGLHCHIRPHFGFVSRKPCTYWGLMSVPVGSKRSSRCNPFRVHTTSQRCALLPPPPPLYSPEWLHLPCEYPGGVTFVRLIMVLVLTRRRYCVLCLGYFQTSCRPVRRWASVVYVQLLHISVC